MKLTNSRKKIAMAMREPPATAPKSALSICSDNDLMMSTGLVPIHVATPSVSTPTAPRMTAAMEGPSDTPTTQAGARRASEFTSSSPLIRPAARSNISLMTRKIMPMKAIANEIR